MDLEFNVILHTINYLATVAITRGQTVTKELSKGKGVVLTSRQGLCSRLHVQLLSAASNIAIHAAFYTFMPALETTKPA